MAVDTDFKLGNMADDLVDLTLSACGRKDDKNPKFPRVLYDSYVNKIICVSLEIQEACVIANQFPIGSAERVQRQKIARANSVYFGHLIRIAYGKKWITEKQRDRLCTLSANICWKVSNWIKSDNEK